MGLSFSVRPPTPAPPSLLNMYKALANDYPSFTAPPARGGSLIPWADRGVLLLNACLTVRAGAANSHANRGWERLTGKALEAVATARRRSGGVVFMAWGAEAAKRVAGLDTKAHLVLHSVHPSPLSARRGFVCFFSFFPGEKGGGGLTGDVVRLRAFQKGERVAAE